LNANQFVQSNNLLPNNWLTYIPNYKIYRTGIVKGVDVSLSIEEICQGIKWMDRPLEIKLITRLKFRDRNNNNDLKDSSTIKIEFLFNLFLEFLSIWSIRTKVRPYINKVRRCYNCLRWSQFHCVL